MKNAGLVLILILAAGAVAFFAIRPPAASLSSGPSSENRTSEDDAVGGNGVHSPTDAAHLGKLPNGVSKVDRDLARSTADAHLSPEELESDAVGNVLAMPTSEEAAWMRRNGYPTYDDWARRGEIPLSELEARAARNDVVAKVMLADLIAEADLARATSLLEEAMSSGSAFAASVLAEKIAKRMESADAKAKGDMASDIRRLGQVAALLGDYRASEQIALRNAMQSSDGYHVSLAMRSAFRFLSETNEMRRQAGLPPLQPSVRPGFAAWQETLHGPSNPAGSITIDCGARPDLCVPVKK